MIALERLRAGDPAVRRQAIWVGGALVTVAFTALGALTHWLIALALLLGLAVAPFVLRSIDLAFLAIAIVITLLPFAAIQLGIGFNPTFLDLGLLAIYTIWIFRLATREETTLRSPPLGVVVGLFLGLMLVAFLAGLAHGTPTKNQIRIFGELLLGAGLYVIIANLVTDRAALSRIVVALVGLGAASAAVGLGLYLLPDPLEMEILSLLSVVDYPSGPGVLRYINDDPSRLQRAIGTSIDPNSFGGLLALLAAFLAPQVVARRPIVPKRIAAVMLALMTLGVLATVSRGSLVGLTAGLCVVGLARDRRLLGAILLGGALLVALAGVLPWTEAYVTNFADGLMLQDRSTQMRLGEYKDAIRLIERYPLFGVGFGGVRDIDLYRGVSSLYLIIAETMGLIGLAVFVLVLIVAAVRLVFAWRSGRGGTRRHEGHEGGGGGDGGGANPDVGTDGAGEVDDGLRAVALGGLAALTTVAVTGLLDHYVFTYPHAFALFWLILGVSMGAARLLEEAL